MSEKEVHFCIACIWKSMTHKRVKLTENWVSVIGRPFMLAGSGFTDLVTWILYPANTLESLAFSREEWRANLYCLSAGSSLIKKGVWSADKRRKHTLEAEFSKGLNYVDLWHKLVFIVLKNVLTKHKAKYKFHWGFNLVDNVMNTTNAIQSQKNYLCLLKNVLAGLFNNLQNHLSLIALFIINQYCCRKSVSLNF